MTSWLETFLADQGVDNPGAVAAQIFANGLDGNGGNGGSGGTGAGDAGPTTTADGFSQPPIGTYDPSIEAQRRATERGLQQTLQDTKTERKRTLQDLQQQLHDLAVNKKRGKQDINRSLSRGLQDIGTRRSGINLRASRGNEDFQMNLEALARSYDRRAGAQTQAENAAGLIGGGAFQASANKRATNYALDRQPLDIAHQRLGEDVSRALTGLQTDQQRLQQDSSRSLTRLRADTRHDSKLARRDANRKLTDIHRQRQRAKLEATITNADLIQQEAFDAQQRHPQAFTKYGTRNH